MTALETLSWKAGRSFAKRHLAPEGSGETLCGLYAVESGPWSLTREPFDAFPRDPTSCRACLEVWLRNRGKELRREEA